MPFIRKNGRVIHIGGPNKGATPAPSHHEKVANRVAKAGAVTSGASFSAGALTFGLSELLQKSGKAKAAVVAGRVAKTAIGTYIGGTIASIGGGISRNRDVEKRLGKGSESKSARKEMGNYGLGDQAAMLGGMVAGGGALVALIDPRIAPRVATGLKKMRDTMRAKRAVPVNTFTKAEKVKHTGQSVVSQFKMPVRKLIGGRIG